MFDWILGITVLSLILVLKFRPNWLGLVKIHEVKQNEENIEDTNQTKPDVNDLAKQTSDIGYALKESAEARDLLLEILQKLDSIKQIYINSIVSVEGEMSLHDTIDHMKDYLNKIKPNDKLFLEHLKSEINKIDVAKPMKDDVSYIHKMNQIARELQPFYSMVYSYYNNIELYQNHIIRFYNDAFTELDQELKKFRTLKGIYENSSTLKVYDDASQKYAESYSNNFWLFIVTIVIALIFAGGLILIKDWLNTQFGVDNYAFWSLKITGVFVFITLITFFLKRAIHFQRRKDETERTKLELEALPSYMADLTTEDATNLRKDLASKYFGRENDKAPYADMSNIITDQLKLSNELLKTGLEASKVAQKPTDKPNND